jgi:transcriptional regulator with XRE-family HTH domain
LGRRLRELRRQAGLTGTQLAESLSWPQSKVSKLETARQTPTDDDIRAWTRAASGEAHTDELLNALHTLEAQHAEWLRLLRPGLRPHQSGIAELDAKTRLFRVFEATVVPGMLQTAEYARARLAQGVILYNATNDINEAVQARMKRQELLYRPDKRFHFVITETALRLRLCAPEAMLAQLDRLISLSTLPNVRIGVIDLDTKYVIGPWHGFWLRDNERVHVETFSAELNLVQTPEVDLYGKIFEHFAAAASYGRLGRAVITRVADDLAREVFSDDE